ncbi:MAG: hypothetical protein AAF726_18360 [Planctomycetota bacterium]
MEVREDAALVAPASAVADPRHPVANSVTQVTPESVTPEPIAPSRARVRVVCQKRVRPDALLVLRWTEDGVERKREVEWIRENEWVDLPGGGAEVVAYAGLPDERLPGPIVSLARSEPTRLEAMREGDEPVVLDALMTMSLTIRITGDAPELEDLWAQAVPRDRVAPSSPASAFAPGVAVAAGGRDAVLCHGALRCLDLGKGSYVVAVGRRGERPAAFACASIAIPNGGVGLPWPDDDADHACTVRCVPPRGHEPPMDARFHVESPKAHHSVPAVLLPDGRYWVDLGLRGRRDRVGALQRLFVDSVQWGTTVVELEEAKHDYVARFERPAAVTVRVAGGERPTWRVRASHVDRPRGGSQGPSRFFVDGVSTHALQPGRYRLELQRQDSAPYDRSSTLPMHLQGTLATLDVDVDRGGLAVVFPEPVTSDLVVRVVGKKDVEVHLSSRGPLGHSGMSVTDDGGNVRFQGLPAGTYTVSPVNMDPMTVQVPCDRVEYAPDSDD